MQSATFIKTVKWIYALEIDDSLAYFRTGFQNYLIAGHESVRPKIEATYARGIQLNSRAREIENNQEAMTLLDAFGLTQIYDVDWWQSVVGTFLRIIAASPTDKSHTDDVEETLGMLDTYAERMQILVSCVGPLQQLVAPTPVMRLKDFDNVLTMEILSSPEAKTPTIDHVQTVLEVTSELYSTMCRIHGTEEPAPLRVFHLSSETGIRFDFSGDETVVVDVKKLLVDVWVRIRNQDAPHIKDFNKSIVTNLAPCHMIEERLTAGELTQEVAGQLRHQLSALAMKMFDLGVQIREIPNTDTVDNRQLMEDIRQRRLPPPAVAVVPSEQQNPAPVKKSTRKRSATAKSPAKRTSNRKTTKGTKTAPAAKKTSTRKSRAA